MAMKKQYNIPAIQIEIAEATSIMAVSKVDDIVIHERPSDGEVLTKEYNSDNQWDIEW